MSLICRLRGNSHGEDGKKAADLIYALRAKIVMEFSHDDKPEFTQGYKDHEVLEVVTADRCNGLVVIIDALRKELEQVKMHNVMMHEKLKLIVNSEHLWYIEELAEVLSATSEQVEAYRAQIISHAKEEQRESDMAKCKRIEIDSFSSTSEYANGVSTGAGVCVEKIRNNKE